MITIKIGNIEKNYIVYKTTAPINYDGFGTFVVLNYWEDRYVLIEDVHEEWQTMRYASGSHFFEKVIEEYQIDEFTNILWKNIRNME